MDSKEMTRKDFITLTFTLIGSTALAASCSDNTTNNDAGSFGGTGGTSTGGTTGRAGTSGTAGAGGTGTAGAGGTGTATACTDPLPESQVPDQTGHVHMITVPASTLSQTSVQTFTTSPAGSPTHTHTVPLTAANLAALKAGGSVTVISGPAAGHTHMFMVSCT